MPGFRSGTGRMKAPIGPSLFGEVWLPRGGSRSGSGGGLWRGTRQQLPRSCSMQWVGGSVYWHHAQTDVTTATPSMKEGTCSPILSRILLISLLLLEGEAFGDASVSVLPRRRIAIGRDA